MTLKNAIPHLLQFADYHDPILRQKTKSVSFPLSDEDKAIIQAMKYSIQSEQLKAADAAWESAAGMAANQWGIDKQIFLYCPRGDSKKTLEVIINPSYEPISPVNSNKTLENPAMELENPAMESAWEACFSVPLSTGNVKRYTHIRVTYQNEAGETLVRELSGWDARVWQHENDHLNGFLYDDHRTGKCLEKKSFPSRETIDQFYDETRKARPKDPI